MKNVKTIQTQLTIARRFFSLILPMLTLAVILTAVPKTGMAQCPPSDCPPDDGNGCWFETTTFWTLPGGCQVEVDYCSRNYWIGTQDYQQYIVNWIGVESGCDDVYFGTLMNEVAERLYQTMSSIPQCGIATGILTSTAINNCWEYNPMWGVQNCPSCRVYTGCGTGTCTKTCSICFGYSLTCACYEDQITDCVYSSDYTDGSCTETTSNMSDWPAYTCYHIPCSW